MEYCVAEDTRPLDRCLLDVRSCDVYVGIFAFRYGHVPRDGNPGQRSITELEYLCAAGAGKECLLFLLSEEAPWPRAKMDRDSAAIDRLRGTLRDSGRIVSWFTGKDNLARQVSEAITGWERRAGVARDAGWQRYLDAVAERHQWVRMQVIAGAGKDRGNPVRIPLTEVFEPQLVSPGASGTHVPDEVRRYQEQIYGPRSAIARADSGSGADTAPEDEADGESGAGGQQLPATGPEQVLDILGRERAQVILGGPGSGKSTLVQYMMLKPDYACGSPVTPRDLGAERIPFLVDLRKYVLGEAPDFVSYIVARSRDYYAAPADDASVRRVLAEDRRAIVFFDGLDEVFDPALRLRVVERFEAFASAYPCCQIVVTSRIAGYDPQSLGLAGFRHYTLMPLTLGHVRDFADRWYRHYTLEGTERTAAGMVHRIEESPRLLDLAGNPLLLTMMAVIYKDRDLPTERWRLYHRCAETLLEDWDLGKGIKVAEFNLGVAVRTEQKSEILEQVARYMLDHAQPGSELNAIAYGPVADILTGYLVSKYGRPEGEAGAIAVDILNHLTERTYVLAGVGERVFGFVHRTFMEYFAACACLREFDRRSADSGWLRNEIFGAHWHDPAWQEVLLLLIARLHDRGTPITAVIDHVRHSGSGKYPYSTAFAARCLGEVSHLGQQEKEQGRQLLTDLAAGIEQNVNRTVAQAKEFTETALTSFAALAPLVAVPAEVLDAVGRLSKGKRGPVQMTAWRMGFATQAPGERLGYTIGALDNPDDTVRRAAIAALEREWSARDDVGEILARVARKDRRSPVRLAALSALQRSWKRAPAILDVIASDIGAESSYLAIIGLIEYLGKAWAGDERALRLVMDLLDGHMKGWGHPTADIIFAAATTAIASGWPGDAEAFDLILRKTTLRGANYFRELEPPPWGSSSPEYQCDDNLLALAKDRSHHEDPLVREAALWMIVSRWALGDSGIGDLLRSLAAGDTSPRIRSSVLSHMAYEEFSHDGEMHSFILERAANDPDPEVRQAILISLNRWPDSQTREFVHRRLASEPSADLRIAVATSL